MTLRAIQAAKPVSGHPGLWAWPVAAAILAAWPIWRSIAPETVDFGAGWFRLEVLCGLGLTALYAVWAWRWRKRLHDLAYPLWVIVLALHGIIVGIREGDAARVDLGALMIAWTATTAIFASLALLEVEEAGIAAGCKAPHHSDLLPPVLWLGAAYGLAMLAVTAFSVIVYPGWIIVMAVISPGAILAWAALSDTARAVLKQRRVHIANAWFLTTLGRYRRWRLMSPTILLAERPKLVNLYPAEGVAAGDLAALAAALSLDDKTELGRAIQDFGVSHKIRLPLLKESAEGAALGGRSATLPNGTVVALSDAAQLDVAELGALAEPLALAQSHNRDVLAVVERRPEARVLGLLVFAIGTRTGATGALQGLRAQGLEVALSAAPRDARDATALKQLQVPLADGDDHETTLPVIRPDQVYTPEAPRLVLRFGGGRPVGSEAVAQIVAAREDARVLPDLVRFAADFRRRTWIAVLLSNAPGWVLIAATFGYLDVDPRLLVTGVSVIGIGIAVAVPQVLRASPTLAKEVDDE
jgi:hypothetical protein